MLFRSGKSYDVFRNVSIRNCVIWNDWGRALEIGAETRAEEIADVTFENCHVIHVTGPALDCQNVDYADVHDVVYKDITVEFDDVIPEGLIQERDAQEYEIVNENYCPEVIRVEVAFHHEYSAGGLRRGKNRNIRFENIFLYGRQNPAFFFSGYNEESLSENVTVKNFFWNGQPLTDGDYTMQKNAFCKNIQIITK